MTRLPVILPVVIHRRPTGWTAPLRFVEYFGEVQAALRPHLVDFGILLDDIGKVDPDELLQRPITAEAKVVLFCLRLGRTPARFFAELPKLSKALTELLRGDEEDLVVFSLMIAYMKNVGGVAEEETTMALDQALKRERRHDAARADRKDAR